MAIREYSIYQRARPRSQIVVEVAAAMRALVVAYAVSHAACRAWLYPIQAVNRLLNLLFRGHL